MPSGLADEEGRADGPCPGEGVGQPAGAGRAAGRARSRGRVAVGAAGGRGGGVGARRHGRRRAAGRARGGRIATTGVRLCSPERRAWTRQLKSVTCSSGLLPGEAGRLVGARREGSTGPVGLLRCRRLAWSCGLLDAATASRPGRPGGDCSADVVVLPRQAEARFEGPLVPGPALATAPGVAGPGGGDACPRGLVRAGGRVVGSRPCRTAYDREAGAAVLGRATRKPSGLVPSASGSSVQLKVTLRPGCAEPVWIDGAVGRRDVVGGCGMTSAQRSAGEPEGAVVGQVHGPLDRPLDGAAVPCRVERLVEVEADVGVERGWRRPPASRGLVQKVWPPLMVGHAGVDVAELLREAGEDLHVGRS